MNTIDSLHNKHILVRVDLNVPLRNKTIVDDYRLQSITPLLDQLIQNNNVIILATHLGRPKGKKDPNLSTKLLIPWFENHGYDIIFEPDLHKVPAKQYKPGTIVLLENLRFNSGEKKHDQSFAQHLADCAEYYINDAFALMHRDDTSITDVPQLFEKEHIFYGPLIQNELDALEQLKHPKQPYVIFLGGGKVSTKLPIIRHFLDNASHIVVLPALVFTLLKTQGKEVGNSLVDEDALAQAQNIMKVAQAKKGELVFPVDYQIALDNLDGPLKYVNADNIPANGIGISIGPKTLKMLEPMINEAKTIFCNAAMGFTSRPETLQGTYDLLNLIAKSDAYSVIGGGDTVSVARALGIQGMFNYCSTGGGATLYYLAGQQLPGLKYWTQSK